MLSVSHLTALDAVPEDFVDWAAAAGFDGVGLRILPPKHAPDRYPVAGDVARCRALRSRARDAGISIFEAESFGVDQDTDILSYRPALDCASELGATMLIAGGIDPDEDRLVENYAMLADLAQERGLVLGIEFMPIRPMARLADAVRVQRRIDHPAAKLLIDTLHLARAGDGVQDVSALNPDDIAYIHIADAVVDHPGLDGLAGESRAGRLYPGEGALPLRELFGRLPAEMPVSLEAPHRDQQDMPAAQRLLLAGRQTRAFFNGLTRSAAARQDAG